MNRLRIISFCSAILILRTLSIAQDNPLKPLEHLIGDWGGEGEGISGTSKVERKYEMVLGGEFIHYRTRAVFSPQEKNPKGEIHEDWGMISFDQSRKLFVFREFYMEGFVIQFIPKSISSDGGNIQFVSEVIENAPSNWKARLTLKRIDQDTIEEKFFVSTGDEEFSCFSTNILRRKKAL